jgi:phosphomethylpyrimidine synthase
LLLNTCGAFGSSNEGEVKEGLIAYRIAAHAADLVKNREKTIKWDMEMIEARRTLDWDKQLSFFIHRS